MKGALILPMLLLPAVALTGATVWEGFSENPASRGWQTVGDPSLFSWDESNRLVRVTWDSSRSNSYLYLPLKTILARDDDFELAFDLWLDDVAIGTTPDKPDTFQLAAGLIDRGSATSSEFRRGAGSNGTIGPRNLVEFDYFPDSGFGATISPTVISTNNQFATSFSYPLTLDPGRWFHIRMIYTASNGVLQTQMERDGTPFGPIADTTLPGVFTDFRVDAFAVCSYSDGGQFPPEYAGSIVAHGRIDNVRLVLPDPPVTGLVFAWSNALPQVSFNSRSNWLYSLQRFSGLLSWQDVPSAAAGTGKSLILIDTEPPVGHGFYRVRAQRP